LIILLFFWFWRVKVWLVEIVNVVCMIWWDVDLIRLVFCFYLSNLFYKVSGYLFFLLNGIFISLFGGLIFLFFQAVNTRNYFRWLFNFITFRIFFSFFDLYWLRNFRNFIDLLWISRFVCCPFVLKVKY
jgi:hypothetical protein